MKNIHTFEEFLRESRVNEAKIDTYTIVVDRHSKGHMVMSINHWDKRQDLEDYLKGRENDYFPYYEVSSKELDSKIAELKKEFSIKDNDVFIKESVNEMINSSEAGKAAAFINKEYEKEDFDSEAFGYALKGFFKKQYPSEELQSQILDILRTKYSFEFSPNKSALIISQRMY